MQKQCICKRTEMLCSTLKWDRQPMKGLNSSIITSSFSTLYINNREIQTHACARARNTHGDSFCASTHELARLAIYSPSRLAHLLNRTKPEEWRWPCAATRREKRIRSTFSLEPEAAREKEGTLDGAERGRRQRSGRERVKRRKLFILERIARAKRQDWIYVYMETMSRKS